MTIVNPPHKARGIIKKAVTLSVLSLTAFSLGLGSIAYINAVSNPRPDSVSALPSDFGRNYGVTKLVKTEGEETPGLQSVTASFTIAEQSDLTLSKSASYIAKSLSAFSEKDIVNVIIKGESADKKKTYDLKFYGGASTDFTDGSFQNVVDATNKLYIDDVIRHVSVESKPTLDGQRGTAVNAGILNEKSDSFVMQSSWGKIITAITTNMKLENNLYSISLTNDNGSKEYTKFESFFYDAPTLAITESIEPKVWKAAETFIQNPEFKSLSLQEVVYTQALQASNSKMELIVAGNGEGMNTGDLTQAFLDKATKNINASYPSSYSTSIKFADKSDPFYTAYPQ